MFAAWLRGSRLRAADALLVFSVGGGNREKNVSANLVAALELAQEVGADVYGIVGPRRRLHARQPPTACVVIPPMVDAERSRPTPRDWPRWSGTCW